jgi:hypothetical protein
MEVLVATVAALVVGTAMLAMIQANITSFFLTQGQNVADATARQPLDILADEVRGAQPYSGSALQAAASNSITLYTSTAGAYTQFWLDTTVNPPALKSTTSTGTTTVLVSGVQSLQFTYYIPTSSGSAAYTPPTSGWATTASPHAPVTAELSEIGAVQIVATLSLNGYSRQLTTFVRLRNSPPGAPSWG